MVSVLLFTFCEIWDGRFNCYWLPFSHLLNRIFHHMELLEGSNGRAGEKAHRAHQTTCIILGPSNPSYSQHIVTEKGHHCAYVFTPFYKHHQLLQNILKLESLGTHKGRHGRSVVRNLIRGLELWLSG